ncbi:MAG: dihydroorotase, partial [Gammaproteobacteria bacterium]
MSACLHISGGQLVDPANGIDAPADVFLRGGMVAGIGKKPKGFTAERRIDAGGLLVLPGIIDLCARLREPGEAHKATIAGETRAAAGGGITRLLCPPDSTPVVDTPAVAR